MSGWSKLTNMELDDEDVVDMACPIAIPVTERATFPYGLRICLTHKELRKLDLEPDCKIGDVIDLRCLARVTSVSINETDRGHECRVELQIEMMQAEDESGEVPDAEGNEPRRNPLHDRS